MPGQNTQAFYDLTPLKPYIDNGFTLLTPNFRLARRIKATWDHMHHNDGFAAWEPLPVFSLEAWLLLRWRDGVRLGLIKDRVTLEEGQALELWKRAIESEQQAGGQYKLLQASSAAALASQARERLLSWQVDLTDPRFRQGFELDEDCASFLAWADRFEALLLEGKMATHGDCIADLLHRAADLPQAPLLLLEFDDISPLHRACVKALGTTVEERSIEGPDASCRGIRFMDRRGELDGIARWARDVSQREPQARIGIILSDIGADRYALEYLLRRAFDCTGERYTSLPVNFSTGITLDRAPVVRDAVAVLRLGLDSVTPGEVTRLLRSRFLLLPDATSPSGIKLLQRLYNSGKQGINVADLRYLACALKADQQQGTTLGARLMDMAAMRELNRKQLPSEWLQPLCDVLNCWGWPGLGPLDSLEHQQVELWYATLEQIAGYDELVGKLSLKPLLSLLCRVLSRQVSQPQTADSNIQVLGPLEAAGLEFDYLWLSGMQGSRWPNPPRPSPFIPMTLQRELQMPHATPEREWTYANSLMRQYRRGARELRASYLCQVDSTLELPSALIDGFTMTEDDRSCEVGDDWLVIRSALSLESRQELHAPAPSAQELKTLRGGSALLEDQSQCPFRAFARRRLRAEPLGEPVVGMSAADRGSLMHRALHLLFETIPDSETLAAISPERELELIEHAVNGALAEMPRQGVSAPARAWCAIEAQRLQTLLRQWLVLERQREAFRVVETEAELQLCLDALELRLRVDRIDRMPDGSALIIDYKSGKSRLQDWLGERPAKPQLLLYGIAAKDAPAALSFAQVKMDDCAFVGAGEGLVVPGIRTDIESLVRGGWEVKSWDELNRRWREQLHRLAAEFLAGEAAVDPQSGACTWCRLQAVCRVNRELNA